MVYFHIKLTDHVVKNIKKICDKYDIFIDEFLINEKYANHKNLHNLLIDDLEDFIRKNYNDRVKIKNCLIDLQTFHNILCDVAVTVQKYKHFINKNNLNNDKEFIFSYKYDDLFIE